MLLPDQTYADYVDRHLTKPGFKSSSTSSSSYDRTADFFENIPDFVGASLPAFLYSPQSKRQPADADRGGTPQTLRTSHSSGPAKEQSETSTKSDNCDDVLRLCEDFLCRHRMRPDFFCQYHKALSSTTPSPKQSKASPTVDKAECSAGLSASRELESSVLSGNNINDVVERFTKFSAIYTLPVARRRKTCTKTTGNITANWMFEAVVQRN